MADKLLDTDESVATEELKRLVKSYVVAKGYTLEKLAKELNDRYGTKDSKTGLSNKLARGSLRHIEMLRILDILGYDYTVTSRQSVLWLYRRNADNFLRESPAFLEKFRACNITGMFVGEYEYGKT